MTQDFSDSAGGVRRLQRDTSGAAGRSQNTRSRFKAGAFHWAGIGQFRKNTLKPLGGSIIGNGHVYPL
jgi:hypothetical protein